MVRNYLGALALMLVVACTPCHKPDTDVKIPYVIENDRVVQDSSVARALSATHMVSNYQSPANASYKRHIEFKFSINGQDNELSFGVNHHALVRPANGKYVHPTLVWGKPDAALPEDSEDFLEANSKVQFSVDIRPVLDGFAKQGSYTFANGQTVQKRDFKGVWIAGGSAPLSWDFENLPSRPQHQMSDPDGDGIYTIELTLNTFDPTSFTKGEWKLQHDIAHFPRYTSESMLQMALYNMALDELQTNLETDSTWRTGKEWAGVWTRDVSYSIVLALASIEPQISRNCLMRKVKNGRIIQDTGTGGAWPISTDRMTWALAAWQVYLATGDAQWLAEAYAIISASAEDDLLTTFDPVTGLAYGESSFLDWRKQTYPLWMNPRDIYKSQCLGTNAVHFRSYEILAEMAKLLGKNPQKWQNQSAKIKAGMNTYLWMDEKGYYAQYLYGHNYFVQSGSAENLGEALSLLFGIVPAEKRVQMIEKLPVVPFGVPTVEPQIPGIPPYHNNSIWPFVEAFYTLAAARTQHEAAVSLGLDGIYRQSALFLTNKENLVASNGDFKGTEINSDRQLWSIAATLSTTYRVLFGIDYQVDGLHFAPFIPKKYAAKRSLNNYRYRGAQLDIQISGFGGTISRFLVDGKVQKKAFIPVNLTGKHKIEIVMDNILPETKKLNLKQIEFSLKMPEVTLNKNNTLAWKSIPGAKAYAIYTNGKKIAETQQLSYAANAASYGEWQVQALSDKGLHSFLSEPIILSPAGKVQLIEAETVAPISALPYTGFVGKGFVELSKTVNKKLKFTVEIAQEGEYLLDFRYSNGNGPINTDNKCAIRTLWLNQKAVGAVVLPQRGVNEWGNWAYSNALRVHLPKGKSVVELSFEPHNQNMNVDVNSAMLDHLRITATH